MRGRVPVHYDHRCRMMPLDSLPDKRRRHLFLRNMHDRKKHARIKRSSIGIDICLFESLCCHHYSTITTFDLERIISFHRLHVMIYLIKYQAMIFIMHMGFGQNNLTKLARLWC